MPPAIDACLLRPSSAGKPGNRPGWLGRPGVLDFSVQEGVGSSSESARLFPAKVLAWFEDFNCTGMDEANASLQVVIDWLVSVRFKCGGGGVGYVDFFGRKAPGKAGFFNGDWINGL